MLRLGVCFVSIFCFFHLEAQKVDSLKNKWVDSVFNSLNRKEKIAQLIMYSAYSAAPELNDKEISKLIKDYGIGGIIFFKGFAESQAALTNRYQTATKVPLMIGIDGEYGLAMRLTGIVPFPRQLPLAATNHDDYIYQMGKEIAKQCKQLGIHINFAPVVDINNNPFNPVINDRSFGDDKERVTQLAKLYMRGMQENGIMACLKHFPGHGNTGVDSHYDLPIINRSFAELDTLEMYPFKKLIKEGVASIMIAHLQIPAIDSTPNLAVSLSPKLVQNILKDKLQFKGLIFTDALNMKGVAKYYSGGEIAVKSLQAGNDILLCPSSVPDVLADVSKAMDSLLLDSNSVYESVKKVLRYKYDYVIPVKKISYKNIEENINSVEAIQLQRKIITDEITAVIDKNKLFPIGIKNIEKVVVISVGNGKKTTFQSTVENYVKSINYQINKNANTQLCDELWQMILDEKADKILVTLHTSVRDPGRDFGMSKSVIALINRLNELNNFGFIPFASPYTLTAFKPFNSLVLGYQDYDENQSKTAQFICGAITNNATFPVNLNGYAKNSRVVMDSSFKLTYIAPEEIGISNYKLDKIDSIINKAIKDKTFPGCQVILAKDGKVFYQKNTGKLDYSTQAFSVDNNTVYDLASLTKIMSTTLACMKLYEEGDLELDKTVGHYLKKARKTNKKNITIRQLLTHTGGLVSWIPFYKKFVVDQNTSAQYFSKTYSDEFPIQVTDSMYAKEEIIDSVWEEIWDSPVNNRNEYVYSDLSFYLLQKIVERITKTTIDKYVTANFYKPLGLQYMGYHPLDSSVDICCIAPTECDVTFRNQTICGTVHDQGAALMGGVAGNAGLFANSNDVAIVMQMLLNKGEYGGKKYFEDSTVSRFTARTFTNIRRGLGFDKPEKNKNYGGNPVSDSSSLNSFGHSGFTGTMAWADPDNGLVFVFLSNRINPSAENNLITKNSVRTKIMDEIYSILKQ